MQIPDDCDRLGDQVPPPAAKVGDDARAVSARYAAKLGLANRHLGERRKCEANVRSRYAKGR